MASREAMGTEVSRDGMGVCLQLGAGGKNWGWSKNGGNKNGVGGRGRRDHEEEREKDSERMQRDSIRGQRTGSKVGGDAGDGT